MDLREWLAALERGDVEAVRAFPSNATLVSEYTHESPRAVELLAAWTTTHADDVSGVAFAHAVRVCVEKSGNPSLVDDILSNIIPTRCIFKPSAAAPRRGKRRRVEVRPHGGVLLPALWNLYAAMVLVSPTAAMRLQSIGAIDFFAENSELATAGESVDKSTSYLRLVESILKSCPHKTSTTTLVKRGKNFLKKAFELVADDGSLDADGLFSACATLRADTLEGALEELFRCASRKSVSEATRTSALSLATSISSSSAQASALAISKLKPQDSDDHFALLLRILTASSDSARAFLASGSCNAVDLKPRAKGDLGWHASVAFISSLASGLPRTWTKELIVRSLKRSAKERSILCVVGLLSCLRSIAEAQPSAQLPPAQDLIVIANSFEDLFVLECVLSVLCAYAATDAVRYFGRSRVDATKWLGVGYGSVLEKSPAIAYHTLNLMCGPAALCVDWDEDAVAVVGACAARLRGTNKYEGALVAAAHMLVTQTGYDHARSFEYAGKRVSLNALRVMCTLRSEADAKDLAARLAADRPPPAAIGLGWRLLERALTVESFEDAYECVAAVPACEPALHKLVSCSAYAATQGTALVSDAAFCFLRVSAGLRLDERMRVAYRTRLAEMSWARLPCLDAETYMASVRGRSGIAVQPLLRALREFETESGEIARAVSAAAAGIEQLGDVLVARLLPRDAAATARVAVDAGSSQLAIELCDAHKCAADGVLGYVFGVTDQVPARPLDACMLREALRRRESVADELFPPLHTVDADLLRSCVTPAQLARLSARCADDAAAVDGVAADASTEYRAELLRAGCATTNPRVLCCATSAEQLFAVDFNIPDDDDFFNLAARYEELRPNELVRVLSTDQLKRLASHKNSLHTPAIFRSSSLLPGMTSPAESMCFGGDVEQFTMFDDVPASTRFVETHLAWTWREREHPDDARYATAALEFACVALGCVEDADVVARAVQGFIRNGFLAAATMQCCDADADQAEIARSAFARVGRLASGVSEAQLPCRTQLLVAMRCFKNTLVLDTPRVLAAFVASSYDAITDPSHCLFSEINRFYLASCYLCHDRIPMMRDLLYPKRLPHAKEKAFFFFDFLNKSIANSADELELILKKNRVCDITVSWLSAHVFVGEDAERAAIAFLRNCRAVDLAHCDRIGASAYLHLLDDASR